MLTERPAPILQGYAERFLEALRWSVQESDLQTLQAVKRVGGNELRWGLHFEDAKSFAQVPAPNTYVESLLRKSGSYHFFDLIGTDEIFGTRRWSDEIQPILDHRFTELRNQRYGTFASLLNRFSLEISNRQASALTEQLQAHFIRKPVAPHFVGEPKVVAMQLCARWLVTGGSRIMLVTGQPGAGKSVFALLLASSLHSDFLRDPAVCPAPFLIWFSSERPTDLEDLIAITLSDLGQTDFTVEAIKFLLLHGRIVFILDGFDEISRALAQRAEETVDKLSADINKNTSGRLILTSRPAFLEQENVFAALAVACDEEQPTHRELASYTDEQIHEWVLRNAPDRAKSQSPDRHWQRVQTAFLRSPHLRDLCRTPVYLRMLSEVLVRHRSVRSRYDLVQRFCSGMWERERAKRTLLLSDEQYLLAYEAISALIVDDLRCDATELQAYLQLYFEEYTPNLLAGFDGLGTDTLLKDLAIGPLTHAGGRFSFAHEILTGYFFARLLARCLAVRGPRLADLWNRHIYEPAWVFLPDALQQILPEEVDRETTLSDLARHHQHALLLWNVVRGLGVAMPPALFKGKHVAGLVFENVNLRGMSFDNCTVHDATFVRCDLSTTTFRGARIGHIKFIECIPGAAFDLEPTLAEDAEVVLVRSPEQGEEAYVGKDIGQALLILSGTVRQPVAIPSNNMAEAAIVLIFQSLFKVDRRSIDYPEMKKLENRLRAWLFTYDIHGDLITQYVRTFLELVQALERKGWICRNPNRPRTLVPCEAHADTISEIVRSEAIPIYEEQMRDVVIGYQQRIEALAARRS